MRFRFTLRQLLVAVTVICLLWGLTYSVGVADVSHYLLRDAKDRLPACRHLSTDEFQGSNRPGS